MVVLRQPLVRYLADGSGFSGKVRRHRETEVAILNERERERERERVWEDKKSVKVKKIKIN